MDDDVIIETIEERRNTDDGLVAALTGALVSEVATIITALYQIPIYFREEAYAYQRHLADLCVNTGKYCDQANAALNPVLRAPELMGQIVVHERVIESTLPYLASFNTAVYHGLPLTLAATVLGFSAGAGGMWMFRQQYRRKSCPPDIIGGV